MERKDCSGIRGKISKTMKTRKPVLYTYNKKKYICKTGFLIYKYAYIYVCIFIHTYIYIHTYICIYMREREGEKQKERETETKRDTERE